MTASVGYLGASEAAQRLGVSAKALRLYEARGLLSPLRTEAGWRAYGPAHLSRGAEIAALRGLGFSLAQVARVLAGDTGGLEPALAAHQVRLEGDFGRLSRAIERIRGLRVDLTEGKAPRIDELARAAGAPAEPVTAFDLPWPWGGERFELRDVRALNFIIGPLGSGKTRLAHSLVAHFPGAAFVGLERLEDGGAAARALLAADPALRGRVDAAAAWMVEDGGTVSEALIALLARLEADGPGALVIDMVEQGLDHASQEALIAQLRRRGPAGRPLFVVTRSSAILDLGAVGPDETILFCPPNHSPPIAVAPRPGAPGYEAVASCLATPAVRARTEGLLVLRV